MRTSPFAIANLAVIVAIAGFTLMAVGSGRHSDFTAQTQKLEQQWSEMSSEGSCAERARPAEEHPSDVVLPGAVVVTGMVERPGHRLCPAP